MDDDGKYSERKETKGEWQKEEEKEKEKENGKSDRDALQVI